MAKEVGRFYNLVFLFRDVRLRWARAMDSDTSTVDPISSTPRMNGDLGPAGTTRRLLRSGPPSEPFLEGELLQEPIDEICWNARHRMVHMLGNGAQGVVYLANRQGVEGYETKVAVELYFRGRARSLEEYFEDMHRVARQAMRISEIQIQKDNLITPRDIVAVSDTRVMVMEWVDGLDLRQLLDRKRFQIHRSRLTREEWERLNDVVASTGLDHCRLKPGIAVDVISGCLAGLSHLHRHEIVHCDLKPSNTMIKRTGTKKIIDISCVSGENGSSPRSTGYRTSSRLYTITPLPSLFYHLLSYHLLSYHSLSALTTIGLWQTHFKAKYFP